MVTRLSLVGWASDTGVGTELRDALKNLPVTSSFIVDHLGKSTPSQFQSVMFRTWEAYDAMSRHLDENKPDAILTWETPVDWRFPDLWRRKGIRWFCVVHWDWFDPSKMTAWKTAHLIAPNRMCQEGLKSRYGLDSTLLPIPVDTERLSFKERYHAKTFVTIYGYGGPHERRSLREALKAWSSLTTPPPLIVHAQKKPPEIEGNKLAESVTVEIGNLPAIEDLYQEADVAVLPSRFEGVGLSLLEAQALGLPVIATDAEPMRSLAPDLLVRTAYKREAEIMVGHRVTVNVPDEREIARKVEELTGRDIMELSRAARRRVEESFSWKVLKERWLEILGL